MSLGKTPSQTGLFGSSARYCEERLSENSIYRFLHRESIRLFPDEGFADLFQDVGRCSIPPRIVAVVMTLQRLEGCSDREAVDRFSYDLRWKYACGGLDYEYPGFVHTVLVDMRARLRRSDRPNRIFESVLDVAKAAGLVGRKRVLDSTALYDAVATQDTVTLVRSAIRGLLRVAGGDLENELRGLLKRDDDYRSPGKPACAWDDASAREALVDALTIDANHLLLCLNGRQLAPDLEQAVTLLATVVGQDIARGDDGIFRIVRGVAPDRVISTVDPEARHGHKTAARGFDGYKGHVSIDPDSEIIVNTVVTPGNAADGSVAKELLESDLGKNAPVNTGESEPATTDLSAPKEVPLVVYGDSSYGTADVIEHLESAGAEPNVKAQAPSAPAGKFGKDRFQIDLSNRTVTCPAGALVQIRVAKDGAGIASFEAHCPSCPLRADCTAAAEGRTIRIHPKEAVLQRARKRQSAHSWKADYRAIRPKVERKLAHLVYRRHGGRRARVRGCERIGHDFSLLGAAVNIRRLATLGVRHGAGGWTR